MQHDHITELRVSGLKAIQDLTLPIRGLTVLIGDNGTGKSTIIEALELLRHAAKPLNYVPDIIVKAHSGLETLLRRGENQLRLGVTIEGNGPKLQYDFVLGNVGNSPEILSERLAVFRNPTAAQPQHALIRDGTKAHIFNIQEKKSKQDNDVEERTLGQQALILPWLRATGAQPSNSQVDFQRVIDALSEIEVHAPFETRPLWQQHELNIQYGPRWPSMVEHVTALARYALNLPNAFQELRNVGGETWNRVLERARLGLGEDVRDFRLRPARRGEIELEVVLGSSSDKPFPTSSLSDGQISYLSFIALSELHANRSILAIDEPEAHMHPAMLARVAWIMEDVARKAPVILSTHSDRLLDALTQPAQDIVLCTLNERKATSLLWPRAEHLKTWLEDYRGVGGIRSEGYESHIFTETSRGPSE